MKIGIVGCGNLGRSILAGIYSDLPHASIIASRRDLTKVDASLMEMAEITSDNVYLIENSEIVILALKPYNIVSFLEEHSTYFNTEKHTVVSVATGITIEEIQDALGNEVGVYRAMPNTASAVNESITAIARSKDNLNRAGEVNSIFSALGEVVELEEKLMESATILGACGIAYVLRFMRAMIQGGIEVGFDAKTATKIVSQTMKGASELIIQNDSHPEAEIDKVTTPKGCTIVGLNAMEHAGFSSSLIQGIVTSYDKISND